MKKKAIKRKHTFLRQYTTIQTFWNEKLLLFCEVAEKNFIVPQMLSKCNVIMNLDEWVNFGKGF